MITLKHRSCSASHLDAVWEYDPIREKIICALANPSGGLKHGFEVPVCTVDRPERDSYVITRLSEDTWRISPACFEFEFRAARWVARGTCYPNTELREFISLTGAPTEVQKELEQL